MESSGVHSHIDTGCAALIVSHQEGCADDGEYYLTEKTTLEGFFEIIERDKILNDH